MLVSCAATQSVSKSNSYSDSTKHASLPIDPWSLGPDVFAESHVAEPVNSLESSTDSLSVTNASADPVASIEVEKVEPPAATRTFEAPTPATTLEGTAVESRSGPSAKPDITFTVQLGTFLDRKKAQEFYDRASAVLNIVGVIQADWPFYRLRFGEFETREPADSLYRVAMSRGFYDARVLKQTTAH